MRDLKNEINNTNLKHLTKDKLSKVMMINGKPKCVCDKCINPNFNQSVTLNPDFNKFTKNIKIQK